MGSVEVVLSANLPRRNPMRKKIAIALTAGVAAATVGLGATGTANAAPEGAGKPLGISCMQFGLAGLRSFGPPAKIAPVVVPGATLSEVLAIHRNQPATAAAVLIGFELDGEKVFDEQAVIDACGQPA
jgi:hypothetical protein